MVYSLLIGRFQPFHAGHKAIIDKLLGEDRNVCVAIMDTEISERNPYTYEDRWQMIWSEYPHDLASDRVRVIKIPQIDEAVYGRDVGYGIRQIHLSRKLEAISATSIRAGD